MKADTPYHIVVLIKSSRTYILCAHIIKITPPIPPQIKLFKFAFFLLSVQYQGHHKKATKIE